VLVCVCVGVCVCVILHLLEQANEISVDIRVHQFVLSREGCYWLSVGGQAGSTAQREGSRGDK
jgi:hypothetical protein